MQMKSLLAAGLVSAALLLPHGAAAQPAEKAVRQPDPKQGAALAQRWCASCHVVSKEQAKASDGTRSFAAIAQSPDFSVEKLAFFLLDPHPVMPSMTLSRDEARDLAAYIGTLR
jgi:mono/diheme cytochrome c family protein